MPAKCRLRRRRGPVARPDRPASRTRPASSARLGRERANPARDDPARLLALIWRDVVGAEVAANARPVQLKGGRLTVSASSAAWAQTLQFMSEQICTRLREIMGVGVVNQVVFRHAGWDEPMARASCRPQPETTSQAPVGSPEAPGEAREQRLSPEQREALAALDALDLPSDLRARIARAMEAAFVRGERDTVR